MAVTEKWGSSPNRTFRRIIRGMTPEVEGAGLEGWRLVEAQTNPEPGEVANGNGGEARRWPCPYWSVC